MNPVRIIAALFALALLPGCLATFDGQFDNALAPSLACDKTFIVSEYFRWGISSQLRKEDHETLRKMLPRCGGGAAPAPAAAASAPAVPASAAK